MRCEDVIEAICSDTADATLRGAADVHLAHCNDCRAALCAYRVLRADATTPVPRLPPRAFEHALLRAREPRARSVAARSFWLGAAVGGALAAGIAIAVTTLRIDTPAPLRSPIVNPAVRLAVNEVRAVNVALEAPQPLPGVQIRVVLTGAIALDGIEEREVRWVTDLDRGVNQLTLPVIALGPGSGQVVVELEHGEKRRTFVVDVAAGPPSDGANTPLPQSV